MFRRLILPVMLVLSIFLPLIVVSPAYAANGFITVSVNVTCTNGALPPIENNRRAHVQKQADGVIWDLAAPYRYTQGNTRVYATNTNSFTTPNNYRSRHYRLGISWWSAWTSYQSLPSGGYLNQTHWHSISC